MAFAARILGSAAGGGFPQWNCACDNCRAVRAGDVALEPRTQDSVAVSADGERITLLNVSPDVARQIEAHAMLHPRRDRSSPIHTLILTNGDLDHVLGLYCLRESTPLLLLATRTVLDGLAQNAMTRTLDRFPGHVTMRALELGAPVTLDDGLTVTAVAAPGKVPIHLEGRQAPCPEDNVALFVQAGATRLAYAPGVRSIEDELASALAEADLVLFDGTFFTNDELPRRGLGTARAEQMGHIPVRESLDTLRRLRATRRIYTHINNTNPILRSGSAERATVERAGWEIATDGLVLA